MPTWKYLIAHYTITSAATADAAVTAWLNSLGAQGWEVYHIVYDQNAGATAFLKQPTG